MTNAEPRSFPGRACSPHVGRRPFPLPGSLTLFEADAIERGRQAGAAATVARNRRLAPARVRRYWRENAPREAAHG